MSRRWDHVCVDLETLATTPDAVVLQMGAVAFDADEDPGKFFLREVALRASDQRERRIESGTLGWWLEREKEGVEIPGLNEGVDLFAAFEAFCGWFREHAQPQALVWAWGMDFDFGILRDVADECGLELPWKYSRQRCARTLCTELGVMRKGPVTHDAMQDAEQEAKAIREALARARGVKAEKLKS